ncbi:hypothetical protein ACWDCL_03865 [Streptomyces sp. NPDC001009]
MAALRQHGAHLHFVDDPAWAGAAIGASATWASRSTRPGRAIRPAGSTGRPEGAGPGRGKVWRAGASVGGRRWSAL